MANFAMVPVPNKCFDQTGSGNPNKKTNELTAGPSWNGLTGATTPKPVLRGQYGRSTPNARVAATH